MGRRTVSTIALLVLLVGLLVVLLVVIARLTVLLWWRITALLRVRALLWRIALLRGSVSSAWSRRAILVRVLVVGIRHCEERGCLSQKYIGRKWNDSPTQVG